MTRLEVFARPVDLPVTPASAWAFHAGPEPARRVAVGEGPLAGRLEE